MRECIALLTPVSHIDGFIDLLNSADVDYVFEGDDFLYSSVTAIFVNPNQQSFFIDQDFLRKFSSLQTIVTASTGLTHISPDVLSDPALEIISNRGDFELLNNIPSTAELSLALTLTAIRNMHTAMASVRTGSWEASRFRGRQLSSLAIGIFGAGRLGKIYSNLVSGFQSKKYICDPLHHHSLWESQFDDCKVVSSLNELVSIADVVSLHVHPGVRPYIDAEVLDNPQSNCFVLVNTSRGEVVDEDAVIRWLKRDRSRVYATDVVQGEGWGFKSKIRVAFEADAFPGQLVVTPHIGGETSDAQELAYKAVLLKYLETL